AVGLREVAQLMGSGRGASLGAALAFVLLPLLQWSVVRAESSDGAPQALGHERASLRDLRSMLNLVPDGSTLIEEDATADILIRPDMTRRRSPKPLTLVPAVRSRVRAAFEAGGVYALPSGQRKLALLGFAIEPVVDPRQPDRRIPGLAAIDGTRPCAELQP